MHKLRKKSNSFNIWKHQDECYFEESRNETIPFSQLNKKPFNASKRSRLNG